MYRDILNYVLGFFTLPIKNKFAAAEIVFAFGVYLFCFQIEPMIVGLTTAFIIHLIGMVNLKRR